MPRRPRLYLADVPCHVTQRGNNQNDCFHADADYQFYLNCLRDACQRYSVSLHSYVLISNRIHLLLTPSDSEGVSRAMQSIGRRYVQYFNFKYKRTGTLWEGRHKSCLLDSENYLLLCMRYIELNPVRDGIVNHPSDYPWSSYPANAELEDSNLINPHPVYNRLGADIWSRQHAYRCLFDVPLDEKSINNIQKATHFSVPLGDQKFKHKIETTTGQSIGYAKRGRPSKKQITDIA